jgi:hypothetical protein
MTGSSWEQGGSQGGSQVVANVLTPYYGNEKKERHAMSAYAPTRYTLLVALLYHYARCHVRGARFVCTDNRSGATIGRSARQLLALFAAATPTTFAAARYACFLPMIAQDAFCFCALLSTW